MKIRIGFISNSSTTSFVVFGVSFKNLIEIAKIIKIEYLEEGCKCEFDRITCKFCPHCGTKAYIQNKHLYDNISQFLLNNNLDIENFNAQGVYVGKVVVGENNKESGVKLLGTLNNTNNKLLELFDAEGRFYNIINED
jgi:hypothetical protein